jgi:hypothetical protein
VDPAAPELDEQQDVQRPEPGCLDGKEVAGDDATRLCPEELGPAPRRRTESRTPSRVRIVVAPTRMPSSRNSPPMRTQPDRGFSRASRTMSSRTSGSSG